MSDDTVTLYVKVHLHNILEIDDEGQQFMADVSLVRRTARCLARCLVAPGCHSGCSFSS
jgi:hypothetical protein